jgi:DNA-directed RNA polymerase subunit RPC12/RpoP
MKLRDLRELYEAPKDDNDDLDDENEVENTDPAPGRTFVTGVDLASESDESAHAFRCPRCKTYVVVKEVETSPLAIARCPKCDGCTMCEALYDDKGDLVPLTTALSFSGVDGELVTYRMICERCMSEKARLLGLVAVESRR